MTLRVVTAGLLTTVQDLGRRGHQHEGVPEGGAMDAVAARLANLVVGNDEHAAVLEATLVGPTLVFERAATFALAGADFDATLDGAPVAPWRSCPANRGATLALGRARDGCRAYVAVAGGVDVAVVLGSRSTCLAARFGGHHGRALRAGDALPLGSAEGRPAAARSLAPAALPARRGTLRVVAGEHLSRLTTASRTALFGAEFIVGAQSNRMGYRLEGQLLEMETASEPLSAAVTMGTIQSPPGGSPILLMADRQTTGGYPRLGQVATADLGAAAQLGPGDTLRFEEISLDDAQRLYLERERAIAALRRALAHAR